MGATPPKEFYVLFRRGSHLAADADPSIEKDYVGEYATSVEMASASISVLKAGRRTARPAERPGRVPVLWGG